MADHTGLSRRNFIASTAFAAGAAALGAQARARAAGANERLRVGFIGCGGMAQEHLASLMRLAGEENLAFPVVCDVFTKQADRFQQRLKVRKHDAVVVQDYRRVLDRDDVDYVVIATPEHSHAHITLDALDAGKHVYVEKPLTHTIPEARAVVAKAKETGLKVQVGVQGMADDSYPSARRAILDGKIGAVVQAQIDYVRNYTGKGPWRKDATDGSKPKPPELDWDAWLRPAAPRPWDPHRYEEWRCYAEYSGGIATDLMIHRMTRILQACNLAFPSHVVGMGGIYTWPDGRDLPDSFELLAEYPAVEGITNGMTVHVLGTMANDRGIEHCIRGTAGTLTFTEGGWEIRDDAGSIVATHQKTGSENVTPHHVNHHRAIREGAALNCPPELGMYGVAVCAMANRAWREKRMIAWDSAAQSDV